MMSDTELQNWVSDKLHDALGMSDRNIVHYLIGLGKKTDNVDRYIKELDAVLGDEGNFQSVATDIWNRIPRKTKKESVNRVKEREAIAEEAVNKTYKMLSDTDDDDDDGALVIKPVKSSKKNKKREEDIAKKKRKKKKGDNDESSDNDDERRREKDLRERDEFAERLKKKVFLLLMHSIFF